MSAAVSHAGPSDTARHTAQGTARHTAQGTGRPRVRGTVRDTVRDSDHDTDRGSVRDSDRGSGSVLTVSVIAVVLVLAVVLSGLARASNAQARAQGAADLAALAAADHLSNGGSPNGLASPGNPSQACEIAAEVVAQHDAAMGACAADGVMVQVEVGIELVILPGWRGVANAAARAGPVGME